MVIVQTTDSVFGYFNTNSIQKSERYVSSDNSWIFSLLNKYKVDPHKFMIKGDKNFISLY